MGSGVEIPFHEDIIFNLCSTSADRFLEQHPPGIFFIGQQLVDGFPILSGSVSGGWDALLFQASSDFPQTITSKILLKYPAHYLRLIGIHHQFSIRTNFISIAFAASHLGTAILKPFPETVLDGFTFLYRVHFRIPFENKNTAVK